MARAPLRPAPTPYFVEALAVYPTSPPEVIVVPRHLGALPGLFGPAGFDVVAPDEEPPPWLALVDAQGVADGMRPNGMASVLIALSGCRVHAAPLLGLVLFVGADDYRVDNVPADMIYMARCLDDDLPRDLLP
ncbi:hypothetical protein [Nocardioides ochotonae]|uniref:hypothetical protein n=1 Tax=Nocardioides ochotonae TaxID=2685869 RepID=UPI00140AA28E|nr:hypothetical protein [Nocardioides ochotonae]